jgi:hypothetical protein
LGFGAVRGGFGPPLGGEVGCSPDMHNGDLSGTPNVKQCCDSATKHSPCAQGPPSVNEVRQFRSTGGEVAKGLVGKPHKFRYTHRAKSHLIIAPRTSSERRPYIPFGLLSNDSIVNDSAQAIYDGELWHLAILLSLMHMAWVRTVSGKLTTRLRYASGLCYNTFPVPTLTEQNKANLTRSAAEILLAREAHFPATIAELYDPEAMPGRDIV